MMIFLIPLLLLPVYSYCDPIKIPSVKLFESCPNDEDIRNVKQSISYTLAGVNVNPCGCSSDVGSIWTRVVYLDMTESSQHCPSAWATTINTTVRACGRRSSSNGSCTWSVLLTSLWTNKRIPI